ncbi:NUDIX domain-containing protein [Halobacillus dabanensis]|uniref:NUDIX domain-containing protein n=1 Tax=Halobacillus dabanensis TaxID=240302 RepID=A0A1I3WLS5_HALDA|nr:CoA pyrophosphatase [Halobacillus dabanensis]SFK08664.1 NUDIX domain-containing protein [Halobacillus dabanensis]
MNAKTILDKVKKHEPSVLGHEQFRKFAVLLPLIEKNGELHVVFEVRSHQLRRQPGEICFPGGKIDPEDPSAKQAAIRETEEELGVESGNFTEVHPLDYLISPFGMIVYSFAGYLNVTEEELIRNPDEVREVFTVPLSFFMENGPRIHHVHFEARPESNFPFDLIPGGEDYNWRTRQLEEYFYIYGDKVIWGMTARILAHFVDLIKQ